MKRILDHYEVNRSTMALLPATHIDYCTIVLEENQQLFVLHSEIIDSACRRRGRIRWVKISGIPGGIISRLPYPFTKCV